MANKRVTDLPKAEKMLDGDILHIIQDGKDKQIPANKVGGDGFKKAETKAEAEAMVESGDLEHRGIVLVENDGDGVPSPSELAEINRELSNLITGLDKESKGRYIPSESATANNGVYYRDLVLNKSQNGRYLIICIGFTSSFAMFSVNLPQGQITTVMNTDNSFECFFSTSTNNLCVKRGSASSFGMRALLVSEQ